MTKIVLCKRGGQVQVAVTIPAPKCSDLSKIHCDVLGEITRIIPSARDDYAMEPLHGNLARFSIDIANPRSKNEILVMANALYTALKPYVQDLVIDATEKAPEESLA